MKSKLQIVSGILEEIVFRIAFILLLALSINQITAVAFRYFFNKPIYWADELSLMLFTWVTFLGGALGVKKMNNIAVTLILDRLKPTAYYIVQIVIQLVILSFASIVFYKSVFWLTTPSILSQMMNTIQIPIWIAYLIVPVSTFLMMVFTLEIMFNLTIKQFTREGRNDS